MTSVQPQKLYQAVEAGLSMDVNRNCEKGYDSLTLVINFGNLMRRSDDMPNSPVCELNIPALVQGIRNTESKTSNDDKSRSTDSAIDSLSSSNEEQISKPNRLSNSASTRPHRVKSITPSYHRPVRKGESLGSIDKTSSSEDENQLSPAQIKTKVRRRRSSHNGLRKFISTHSQTGLTAQTGATSYPTLPYTEEFMRKKQYLSIQKHHSLRDVKFDSTGNIILTTKSSIQKYDNNGVFVEKLCVHRVAEPWGLHINNENNHLFVSDHDEDCVKEFNSLGIIVQEYGPVPSPCGVTVSHTGYVFVCSSTDSCVYVFDKRAQLITKIGEGVLKAPTYIVLNKKSIFVSDESQIVGFNIHNETEFLYGQSDGSRHPACLCVDNHGGYILATSYYRDRLIAFNQSTQRAIKVKDTSRPSLCAISPYGQLLIAESIPGGTILKMFRMK